MGEIRCRSAAIKQKGGGGGAAYTPAPTLRGCRWRRPPDLKLISRRRYHVPQNGRLLPLGSRPRRVKYSMASMNETDRANVLSLATAVPRYRMLQTDAAEAAREAFAHRFPDFGGIARVFKSTGIQARYVVKPIDWYLTPIGWPERTAAYLEGAQELFVAATEKALAAAGCQAADIDAIVTVSSTGIATPSLEARVAGRLPFRSDVERVPVFGLGCAGGVNGMAIASRLAEARPGSTVLMVAVEICSTAFRLDHLTKANMVAPALFADGAAAYVLRAGDSGLALIEGAGQHMWPDTLDIMGWNVDGQGLGVIFDRDI